MAAGTSQRLDEVAVERSQVEAACSRKRPSREGFATGADFQQTPPGYRVDGGQDTAND